VDRHGVLRPDKPIVWADWRWARLFIGVTHSTVLVPRTCDDSIDQTDSFCIVDLAGPIVDQYAQDGGPARSHLPLNYSEPDYCRFIDGDIELLLNNWTLPILEPNYSRLLYLQHCCYGQTYNLLLSIYPLLN